MFWHEYWSIVLLGILCLPLFSVAVFLYWIRKKQDITAEIKVKYWEVFIKLISAFTVIVSGAMLFGKYIDQQDSQASARQYEVNRELALKEADFLRQKLNYDSERFVRAKVLLGEAKRLSANMASVDSPDDASLTRFDELYYADLIGVEKRAGKVEGAMVRYRKKLRNDAEASDKSLKQLSLELSHAVESELKEIEDNLLLQHEEIANLLKSDN